MDEKIVKVAVIGLGSMGRGHVEVYKRLEREGKPVKMVAVCDIDPKKLSGESASELNLSDVGKESVDYSAYRQYTSYDELFKKEKDIIDEAENDDRLVREGERIARYYDEITQAPRKRLHNIFIFTDDDLDNEDVIAEIDVRPTYKRTRDEVIRIREKEAATTAPSPLEDGGFIINQP